jgi:hypothetical protein
MRAGQRRSLALACAGLIAGACAETATLYARRTAGSPPSPRGSTIAVLPPVSLSGEHGPALVATRTADAVFASPIGHFRFLPPSETARSLGDWEGAAAFLARLRSLPPPSPPASGKARRMFGGKHAAGVALGGELRIYVREGPALEENVMPASLEPALASRFAADWVLASLVWAGHQQADEVIALYGILPLVRERRTEATAPRALFALYRAEDGALAWEAFVGRAGAGTGRVRYQERLLDLRALPMVVLAELITGDAESPVARAWSAQQR